MFRRILLGLHRLISCVLSSHRIPDVGEWAWYHKDFIRGQKSNVAKIETLRPKESRVEEDEIFNEEMQNQYPTTLSASVLCGSPAPADDSVEKSIAGLDQLAAAIEDEYDDDEDTDHDAQKDGVCVKLNKAKKKRKTCKHEGCTNQRKQRGFCTRHYNLSIGRSNSK